MSKVINGANGVRLTVLLTVAALTFVVMRGSSSPSAPAVPVSAPAPQAQAVAPGATLLPVATPPAASKPKPHRAKRGWATSKHRLSRHERQLRHRRRAAARTAARRRHVRARWLRSGGRDIGWPQCPRNVGIRGRRGLGQPLPDAGVRFVIVGLTNGRAFTPNPCLTRHLRWVRTHHVWASAYAFATYPTRAQLRRYRGQGPFDRHRFLGSLRNAGHAAAGYNIRVMQRNGFTTPHVWMDVEPSSSRPWSGRRDRNRAVVEGWVRGYRDAGYTVGFYSTTNLWHSIVGNLRLGVPEWRTAGPVQPSGALKKCREGSFQGGPAVIAQWWTAHRDFDRMCPSTDVDATMAQFFHKW